MNALPMAITGEHLKAWDFECVYTDSGNSRRVAVHKIVKPHIVFFNEDVAGQWRFQFKCPRCWRIHAPALVSVVDSMYTRWELETRSAFHPAISAAGVAEEVIVTIVAVDPGPTKSAWMEYDGYVIDCGIEDNDALLNRLSVGYRDSPLVIESIDFMGLAVGRDVFETVFWSGRFCQAWPGPWHRIPRQQVKLYLCGSARATDANIRQSLIDRFGGDEKAIGGRKCPKCHGKGWTGRKREACGLCGATGWQTPPGPLHGLATHLWSALAVACTWTGRNSGTPPAEG